MADAAQLPFELALLAEAVNYQQWMADRVRPHLGSRILEIGSGIGNLSRWLPVRERLLLTESDPSLFATLKENVAEHFGNDKRVSAASFDLSQTQTDALGAHDFDTVVSFNVMEHIADDAAALSRLARLLVEGRAKGPLRIVTLVPAHSWAYGSIDRIYGHFRRYSKRAFEQLSSRAAPGWKYSARYYNVVGLPGWVVMGKILRQRRILPAAVKRFDALCPYIRDCDDFLHDRIGLPLGQSLIAVLTFERPPS